MVQYIESDSLEKLDQSLGKEELHILNTTTLTQEPVFILEQILKNEH